MEAASRAELASPRGHPSSARGRSRRTPVHVRRAPFLARQHPAAHLPLSHEGQVPALERRSSLAWALRLPALDVRAWVLAVVSALVVTAQLGRLLALAWYGLALYAPVPEGSPAHCQR